MNEDERGITPANVTAMTIQRDGPLWWVIIEQGNGDLIKEIRLTEMERVQLATMICTDPGQPPVLDGISFVDFDRTEGVREKREGGWAKVTFFGFLPEGAKLFGSEPRPELLNLTGRLAGLFGFTGLAHLTVSRGRAYQDAAAETDKIRAEIEAGECIAPQRVREALDSMAREGQAAGIYEATQGAPPRRCGQEGGTP